jgi:hypothetical protein
MSLSFFTKSQEMNIVNAENPFDAVSAFALQPNHNYNVYVLIQNDSNIEAQNVQVTVTHSPFGIGLTGPTDGLTQPLPVNVPPKGPGGNGIALVRFGYHTPAGGHACIYATMSNGTGIGQNTTIYSVAVGTTANLSFLVYGHKDHSEVMTLTLEERLETGVAVSPGQSWNPLLVAPAGIGPTVPTAAPIDLNLPANSFYSIGLNVTPPVSATGRHVFHIEGSVNGVNVGSVDIWVNADPNTVKSDPYILGGYQSADVILRDLVTGFDVPLGGRPNGPWSTTLNPDTEYGFAARIHNASSEPAINTVVRFWEFPGGVGTIGTLVDVQVATIPPLSEVIVESSKKFKSAPLGQHKCVAVSIYNALAGTCEDATTANQVSDPNAHPEHSCSAWRNTDSQIVSLLGTWEIDLQLATAFDGTDPVEVKLQTLHVPAAWKQQEGIKAITNILDQTCADHQKPMYLLPVVREKLKPIDVQAKIKQGARIRLKKHKPATLSISGQIPKDVKPGDKILVHVTALYPKTEGSAPRAVEFTQILHIEKSK